MAPALVVQCRMASARPGWGPQSPGVPARAPRRRERARLPWKSARPERTQGCRTRPGAPQVGEPVPAGRERLPQALPFSTELAASGSEQSPPARHPEIRQTSPHPYQDAPLRGRTRCRTPPAHVTLRRTSRTSWRPVDQLGYQASDSPIRATDPGSASYIDNCRSGDHRHPANWGFGPTTQSIVVVRIWEGMARRRTRLSRHVVPLLSSGQMLRSPGFVPCRTAGGW